MKNGKLVPVTIKTYRKFDPGEKNLFKKELFGVTDNGEFVYIPKNAFKSQEKIRGKTFLASILSKESQDILLSFTSTNGIDFKEGGLVCIDQFRIITGETPYSFKDFQSVYKIMNFGDQNHATLELVVGSGEPKLEKVPLRSLVSIKATQEMIGFSFEAVEVFNDSPYSLDKKELQYIKDEIKKIVQRFSPSDGQLLVSFSKRKKEGLVVSIDYGEDYIDYTDLCFEVLRTKSPYGCKESKLIKDLKIAICNLINQFQICYSESDPMRDYSGHYKFDFSVQVSPFLQVSNQLFFSMRDFLEVQKEKNKFDSFSTNDLNACLEKYGLKKIPIARDFDELFKDAKSAALKLFCNYALSLHIHHSRDYLEQSGKSGFCPIYEFYAKNEGICDLDYPTFAKIVIQNSPPEIVDDFVMDIIREDRLRLYDSKIKKDDLEKEVIRFIESNYKKGIFL